ncbi:phosphoenolpyruvate carboxykinase (GTP) [Metallosphaera tengchongensis]|uniref:Phosphoenolpyruvate carboxykinase [GTP] n=1 Tax=Metallosphaera tengchongensis TaxID=1532350 RepID=A0A6N0NSF6_9CREN|nr:phosphoenolpyruvate carboxykinase (GTP) [Metallosphaera tengchongensis]QKQ99124.1 phosphoenolpyruvate carboxykinase (GTP) [Metallosphaera tengchongensis]
MEVLPSFLKGKLSPIMETRLLKLRNVKLLHFLEEAVDLCEPESVYIVEGTEEDISEIRNRALLTKEETELNVKGHTIHFDHALDQARAREDTFILGDRIPFVNTKPRKEGLEEVKSILKGAMKGRVMYVGLYSLGPVGSPAQILAVQITDSPYVIHSENILYRNAYREFEGDKDFLKFIHSKGSQDVKKRRIVIDLDGVVYSVNTTYAGNSVGLKKLALRLTLNRAVREGWLSEHMAIVGLEGSNGVHYVTAAFPSGSGKTSTSMMGRLISDDLAFIMGIDGDVRAWNPEAGVFGIIQGINSKDDPIVWKVLHTPGEVIFSNVLMTPERSAYWDGSGLPEPEKGINFSGEWWKGKKDDQGKPVPPSHPNARFTVSLKSFDNLDPNYDNPNGVKIDAVIFGVRDYKTLVPIAEAFDWEHGVVTMGASMESARTSAVIGKQDEMEFNPMALLDFISVPLGKYVQNYINFGKRLRNPPKIFGVNYFLKDGDKYVNSKEDKRVWLRWVVERLEGRSKALETPIGKIPLYEDLRRLFGEALGKEYSEKDYEAQFSLRLRGYKEKYERILDIYSKIDTPKDILHIIERQIQRIEEYRKSMGDVVSPFRLKVIE